MRWWTVFWSLSSGICVTFAAVHFFVWLRVRDSKVNLAFALTAIAAAATAFCEMLLMHTQTAAQYGRLVQLAHIPVGVLAVAFLWFIYLYLQAGNRWLAWSFVGLRAVILAVNFLSTPNINFSEIVGLRKISIWGEMLSVPEGIVSHWEQLDRLSVIVLIAFVVHAAVTAFRRGRKRPALVMGITALLTIASGQASIVMMLYGVGVPSPALSPGFLFIVLVMGYELIAELVQRRRLIREMEINKERMRLAAAAVKLGMWEWDVAGKSIWVTESGRERLSLDESEVTTTDRFLQTVHPDDREPTRLAMSRSIESSGELTMEYRIVDPNGRLRWIAARGRMDPGHSGKSPIVRGISLDVTEQREAALRLQESETRFRATFEQASVGIAHVAPDGTFLRVNQKFCEIVGYSRDDLLERGFPDITSPDDVESDMEAATRLLEGETTAFVTEKRYIRKDGSNVWVNLTKSLVRDSAGNPEWFVSVIQDITKRKRAEKALRESERRLREAQRIAHIGSWELELLTYRFTFLADEVVRIYEVDPAEVEFTYETFLSFLHPEDRETFEWQFERAIEAGENTFNTFRVVMPDGRIKYLLCKFEILHSPEGEPLSVTGTIQDITEREQAATERLQLRNELAHLARVTQLGELSTALAHEVNQPLGAIRNNASAARVLTARLQGPTNDLDEILSDIISDASRAGQIICSLRKMVKKQETDLTILGINDVIRNAVQLFKQTFIIDRVTILLDLGSGLPPLKGDRISIEQVLMNLIMNAVESMRASPRKELKISSSLLSRDAIKVSVKDSGPGVSPDWHEKVFQAFFTTKEGGLGLGLRICQSIIEEHRGRIWLDGGSERGATFCFSLPVYSEQPA